MNSWDVILESFSSIRLSLHLWPLYRRKYSAGITRRIRSPGIALIRSGLGAPSLSPAPTAVAIPVVSELHSIEYTSGVMSPGKAPWPRKRIGSESPFSRTKIKPDSLLVEYRRLPFPDSAVFAEGVQPTAK